MSTSVLPGRPAANSGRATARTERTTVRHRVCMTGILRIDGRPMTSARAVELLHLMAHEGPVLPKKVVESRLYGGYCSRSSLWYPLKVCRNAGIAIHYDRARRSVVLQDTLVFDIDIAVDYLTRGDVDAALWVLGGWPGQKSGGAYSAELEKQLRDAIVASPVHLCLAEVEDTFAALDEGR